MKLLMISAFAAVALFAAASTMLRSHSPSTDRLVGTPNMPSLQELQSTADVNKLPVEEFEDQSLVYSRVPKH
jgi:LPS O-antigen subunit length determinant protein (WzzB/FepE family)